MIKKVVYFIILIIIVFMPTSYAETENTIQEQQETFGINTFIEEAEEYTGEFFEDIDINEILNSAIKGEVDNSTIYERIFNLLGKEVKTSIYSLARNFRNYNNT